MISDSYRGGKVFGVMAPLSREVDKVVLFRGEPRSVPSGPVLTLLMSSFQPATVLFRTFAPRNQVRIIYESKPESLVRLGLKAFEEFGYKEDEED